MPDTEEGSGINLAAGMVLWLAASSRCRILLTEKRRLRSEWRDHGDRPI